MAKGDMSLLGIAAITHRWPEPPPIDDDPPLHVFTHIIGLLCGQLLAKLDNQNGQDRLVADGLRALSHRLAGMTSAKEIVDLIWAPRHSSRTPA
jgi:hypothetical protein